jgi:GR25 family glycosyltransferase involved in LPS biosynthesis
VFLTSEEFGALDTHVNTHASLIIGRDLTVGEVGCALAHKAIYRDHAASSQDWALVLEDDAIVETQHFNQRIEQVLLALDNLGLDARTATVVLLGYFPSTVWVNPARALTRQLVIPTGTFGYLINRSASTTLSQHKIVNFLADWPLESCAVKFYAAGTPLVHHPKRGSIIDSNSISNSRKEHDTTRDGILNRLKRVKNLEDIRFFWHFVIKRGLGFRYFYPLLKRLNRFRPTRLS